MVASLKVVSPDEPFVPNGKSVPINPEIYAFEVIRAMPGSTSMGYREAERAARRAFNRAMIRTALGQRVADDSLWSKYGPGEHYRTGRSWGGASSAGALYAQETHLTPHILDVVAHEGFECWMRAWVGPRKTSDDPLYSGYGWNLRIASAFFEEVAGGLERDRGGYEIVAPESRRSVQEQEALRNGDELDRLILSTEETFSKFRRRAIPLWRADQDGPGWQNGL